jgi:hypothetical protein
MQVKFFFKRQNAVANAGSIRGPGPVNLVRGVCMDLCNKCSYFMHLYLSYFSFASPKEK